ncbi:hypothetical protein D3C73_1031880 [compost metagenome]
MGWTVLPAVGRQRARCQQLRLSTGDGQGAEFACHLCGRVGDVRCVLECCQGLEIEQQSCLQARLRQHCIRAQQCRAGHVGVLIRGGSNGSSA